MKRALFAVVAAVLVLVSYPSTDSLAGASKRFDSTKPSIISQAVQDGGVVIGQTGEDDGGDADDLSGIKGHGNERTGFGATTVTEGVRTMLRMWWTMTVMIR